jgi:ribose/xylose/arabinose/galactoside ABC-type transport system permease subunit
MIRPGPDASDGDVAGAPAAAATRLSLKPLSIDGARAQLRGFLQRPEAGAAISLAILFAALALTTSEFLSVGNLSLVARGFSFVAIAAIGQALVIMTGGIDLSVGSVMGLAGVSAAWLSAHGYSPVIAILGALAAAAVVGLFNGILVAKFLVPAFMVTLASLSIARGLVIAITGGVPIQGFSSSVRFLGQGYWLGIPMPVWAMLVLAVAFTLLLNRTRFGWYVYAIGGNEDATRLSGIRVDRVKLGVYVLAGILAGFGGLLLTARLGVGDSTAGLGYELDVIAATVIGGTSLRGGIGNVVGVIYGAALLAVVRNGLVLTGVTEYWQQIVIGGVIALAVLIDRFRVGRSTA